MGLLKMARLLFDADARRRKRAESARRDTHRSRIQSTIDEATRLLGTLPGRHAHVGRLLDRAAAEFQEGAGAALWRTVDEAAIELGQFDEALRHILVLSKRYAILVEGFLGTPPPFPMVKHYMATLGAGQAQGERLSRLIRDAKDRSGSMSPTRPTNHSGIAALDLEETVVGLAAQLASSASALQHALDEVRTTLEDQSQPNRIQGEVRDPRALWLVDP